jgi:hypothetical protein
MHVGTSKRRWPETSKPRPRRFGSPGPSASALSLSPPTRNARRTISQHRHASNGWDFQRAGVGPPRQTTSPSAVLTLSHVCYDGEFVFGTLAATPRFDRGPPDMHAGINEYPVHDPLSKSQLEIQMQEGISCQGALHRYAPSQRYWEASLAPCFRRLILCPNRPEFQATPSAGLRSMRKGYLLTVVLLNGKEIGKDGKVRNRKEEWQPSGVDATVVRQGAPCGLLRCDWNFAPTGNFRPVFGH